MELISSDHGHEIEPEAVKAQLTRVLSSRAFAQSERLSRFLQVIVNRALAGKSGLNEYALGIDVFDKHRDFDPRLDPIVRVHAGRLRTKLKQYYEAEGVLDTVLIDVPMRTYVPTFLLRLPQGPCPTEIKTASSVVPRGRGLAVRPFASLSVDRNDWYLAEGLTCEVVHTLVRVGQLRIVTLPTAQPPDAPATDSREDARLHSVDAMLQGTVRRFENQVRVSAELVSLVDGSVLWSEMYEHGVARVLPAQETIAEDISRAIHGRLCIQVAGGAVLNMSGEALIYSSAPSGPADPGTGRTTGAPHVRVHTAGS